MNKIENPIIPTKQIFYDINKKEIIDWDNIHKEVFDLKAIATFCALGFMLDEDTFFKKIKALKPSKTYYLDEAKMIVNEEEPWKWHYSPRNIHFNDCLDEFSDLFENFINKKINNRKIILPMSGGLDSRTLFIPIKDKNDLVLCSYEFEGGISETHTAKELSDMYKLPLYTKTIQKGYLWNQINNLYGFNRCFTDFTHPRQLGAINEWKNMADVVLLGHWGDVLFDEQINSHAISYEEQLNQLKSKILKKSGINLAQDLWACWGIEGSFISYITDRLNKLYKEINIDHPSAKIRAFKSKYWAPRWTSINSSLFNILGEPIYPYYSNEICKFICTVPEEYLKGRKIQIEYIKKNCSRVASIPWQQVYPLNLNNYKLFNSPQYYLLRIIKKIVRIMGSYYLDTPKLVTRNWELQFLGGYNFIRLQELLLKSSENNNFIPKSIFIDYLEKFKGNPIKYAHAICMLLTLAIFSDKHLK